MTMMDNDSDSEPESAPTPSPLKDKAPKAPTVPKEESIVVKQEPISAPEPPSLKSPAVLPFPGLLSGRPSPPAMLVKTPLPSAASSKVKSAESSVLSSLGGGVPALPGGKEGLLATLMSSRAIASGKSELFSVKDSDEPVTKKARKTETIKTSDNSVGGGGSSPAGFPFTKLGGSGSGFTILPVSSVSNNIARSLSSGSQPTSSAALDPSRSLNPVSSSVKLANLPGVSLTSVSRSNLMSAGLSPRHGGGLMPPPSSVTLSPVPRNTNVNNVNERTTTVPSERLSEPGDSKPLGSSPTRADASLSPVPVASLNQGRVPDPTPSLKEAPSADGLQGTTDIIKSPAADPGAPSLPSPSKDPNLLGPNKDPNLLTERIPETSLTKVVINNTKVVNKQTLLINPVTGQFEMGPAEPPSEPTTPDQTKPPPLAPTESPDLKSKHKPDSVGSATSGEPSLKLKLKVSLPNNSSKGVKEGLVQSKNPLKVAEPEPKLPKLKIKLKEQSVELEKEESAPDSDPGSAADTPPVQLDLKTRVRIKTLKVEGGSTINSINHISVDTNPEKKKKDKSGGKEKKSGKDRLAVWTESLAKHTKREDSGTKETKSWPELLENRLFTQGSSATLTNLPNNFAKDGGKNQTEKEEKTSDEAEVDHLNWEGPGQEGAEPGPGRTLPPSPPPGSRLKAPDIETKEQLPDKDLGKDPAGITSVLDILEGRRPLGDPTSPLGTRGSQDHTTQQGEDSGIESMDTLSEKSPNQGESPFHGGNDACIEGSRVPTYSSSMGPVSGKLSPPVSDSGSTDSLVTATPPDKSPTNGGATNHTDPSENKEAVVQPPPSNPAETLKAKIGSVEAQPSSNLAVNCDSKQPKSSTAGANQTPNPTQSNALTNSTHTVLSTAPPAHISDSQSNLSPDNIPEENGSPTVPGDKDLIRSCDGALDKCSGDLLEISCPDKQSELTNFMHAYANVKTVNYVPSSSSNNSNSSDCNIITLKNGEKSPPPSTDPAVIKAELRRASSEQVSSEGPPGLLTLTRTGTIKPPVTVVTSLGPGLAVRSPHPLRPGRIVPVKLVSVPGAGMRMVRVAGSEIVCTSSSSLPPRTVILKSASSLKTVVPSMEVGGSTSTTCVVRIPAGVTGSTTSLVRYPAPTQNSSISCDNSPAAGEPSQTSVNPPSPPSSSIPGQVTTVTVVSKPDPPVPLLNEPPAPPEVNTNGAVVTSSAASAKSQTNSTESPTSERSAVSSPPPLQENKLTNGDVPMDSSDLKPERRRVRNGNKNSGEQNGESDGGSLLRPLIAMELTPDPTVVNSNSLPPESPVLNSGKRSRRDTGSSVQSDKSDLSVLSTQSVEPAAKRVKEEEKGRRGSTSPGLRENSRSLERKKGDEKEKPPEKTDAGMAKKKAVVKIAGEGLKKSTTAAVSNGPKNAKPKPEIKKVGRPSNIKDTKPPAAKETKAVVAKAGSVVVKPAAVVKPGAAVKVGAAATVAKVNTAAAAKADIGRRVSTRGKKPEESVTSDKKKKR